MIYTCYEMARDCRADKPEGWKYFIKHYVPAVRKLLAHYAPSGPKLEDALPALCKPESSMFQSLEPAPERWFVAQLRQAVLAEVPITEPEIPLDLETVAAALEPLTVVEKQVAWLGTMRYSAAETGVMMRMSEQTAAQIRGRAAELIRGKVDAWRSSLLSDNGPLLGRAVSSAAGKDCFPAKTFLNILDGRTTWREREVIEQHVSTCWHCVDHFCRMVECVDLLRGLQPMSPAEAESYGRLLGVQMETPSTWKRLFDRS